VHLSDQSVCRSPSSSPHASCRSGQSTHRSGRPAYPFFARLRSTDQLQKHQVSQSSSNLLPLPPKNSYNYLTSHMTHRQRWATYLSLLCKLLVPGHTLIFHVREPQFQLFASWLTISVSPASESSSLLRASSVLRRSSISTINSGVSLRNCLTFSRPCPSCSPS